MKYILISMLVLFFVGCDSKNEVAEEQNSIENIIIDNAYVVLDNEKIMKQYRDFNQHLLDDFDIDFRTITTNDDADIDLFANSEFERLQEESRSHSGKAILMVINTLQDKVRLEVSMALEPVYTDAFISYIERKGFVPYFRNDTIADAIYMAAELISDRAYDAQSGKEFMPPMQSKSIGAGAKTQAHIGIADPDAKKGVQIDTDAGDNPMEVMQRYLKVLKSHNKNPNLDIYTDTTKTFFKKWTVTEINQDHEIHNIAPCKAHYDTLYDTRNEHAVLAVLPYDKHRKCAPYFFKKEQGSWKLDIATMAQILRFNAQMDCHIDMTQRLKKEGMYYAFAFDGYTFGKNGYLFQTKFPMEEGMRWGYQCDGWFKRDEAHLYQQDKEKYLRCWIKKRWPGSPSEVRLGIQPGDSVIGIGSDGRDANYGDFMSYMKQIPSGEVATVIVYRFKNKGREKTRIIRQGIAP